MPLAPAFAKSTAVALRAEADVTSVNVTRSTTAPRSPRSSRSHNGSNSRASTNDNGSRPSIGHSRSSDASNCSATPAGTSGRISSPRAHRCQRSPSDRGVRRARPREGSQIAECAEAPPSEFDAIGSWALGFRLGLWAWPRVHSQEPTAQLRQCPQRQRRERSRLFAARTTVNPARACASRIAAVDVAATAICTAARHRRPWTQLFADRPRLAYQAAEPADVERHRVIAVRLDAR